MSRRGARGIEEIQLVLDGEIINMITDSDNFLAVLEGYLEEYAGQNGYVRVVHDDGSVKVYNLPKSKGPAKRPKARTRRPVTRRSIRRDIIIG